MFRDTDRSVGVFFSQSHQVDVVEDSLPVACKLLLGMFHNQVFLGLDLLKSLNPRVHLETVSFFALLSSFHQPLCGVTVLTIFSSFSLSDELLGQNLILLVLAGVFLGQHCQDAFLVVWQLMCMVRYLIQVVLLVAFLKSAHLFCLLIDQSVDDPAVLGLLETLVAKEITHVINDSILHSGKAL